MVEIVAPSFYQMDRKGNMYELTLNKKNHSSMYLGLVVECHEQGDKHPMKIGQKALWIRMYNEMHHITNNCQSIDFCCFSDPHFI